MCMCVYAFAQKGGENMKVGQTPAEKKPSGMSRAAKDRHNAYQRKYTKENPEAKRAANKRYWEKPKRQKKDS